MAKRNNIELKLYLFVHFITFIYNIKTLEHVVYPIDAF